MGLLSFLKRPPDAPTAPDSRSVEDIRRTVRRRLIGAAALVMVAVVAFPLLFDAAPRPVALDIAIEIPSRDAVAPLPAPRASVPAPSAAVPPATLPSAAASSAAPGGITQAPAAASSPSSAAASVASPATQNKNGPVAGAVLTETAAEAGRELPPSTRPQKPDAESLEAARALAVLEARPLPTAASAAASSAAGRASEPAVRFVVQVGAFADAGPMREARQKVEKLGLKTYTQVVTTPAGPRTRVRVGPFGDRGEADRAAAQIRQAGLTPAVLSL